MKLVEELAPIPIGLVLTLASSLLADASDAFITDSSIVSLIGNGVTIVVLAWYVIYDVRTRTPSMLSAFAAEQAAMRRAFTEEQEECRRVFAAEQVATRESYRTVIEQIRQTFTSEQALLRQAFSAEQNSFRTQHDRELGDLRKMLFEALQGMRTAVHDVRDTAQTLMGSQSSS